MPISPRIAPATRFASAVALGGFAVLGAWIGLDRTSHGTQFIIENGDVRPDMTRAEAKKLVAEMEPERQQRAAKEKNEDDMRSEFLDRFKAFYDFASDFVARFPQHKINIKLCIRNLSQLLEKNDE